MKDLSLVQPPVKKYTLKSKSDTTGRLGRENIKQTIDLCSQRCQAPLELGRNVFNTQLFLKRSFLSENLSDKSILGLQSPLVIANDSYTCPTQPETN